MTSQSDSAPDSAFGWQAPLVLGLITLGLGIVVMFRPSQSLGVIAVLLGIAMIVSGVFQIARALDGREHQRVWRGISGILFILVGLALIRHLDLTVALIGLFVGFTWVIQGVVSLVEAFSGRRRGETGWALFFGVLSLVAGIVVVSAPIGSIAALTIFMGAWLIVLGLVEAGGALIVRRAAGKAPSGPVSVPGQRASAAGQGESASTVGATGGGEPSLPAG